MCHGDNVVYNTYSYANHTIQIHKQDSVVQVRTVLLTSDFGSSTPGERHNSYYANHPQRAAHLLIFKIWIHLRWSGPEKFNRRCNGSKLNSMVENSILWPNGRNSLVCLHGPMSTFNFQLTLSQNPQILRTISSGHDAIHTLAPFSCRGFIMTMVIFIFFARERKTVPNGYAPELLTRIVQSPTKQNHHHHHHVMPPARIWVT